MAEKDDELMEQTDQVSAPQKAPGGSSKFLTIGKYFLILAALVFQAGAAFTIVDENYETIYISIFGSLPDFTAMYDLNEIVVNPAESNGQRFLVVGITLELFHSDSVSIVERNQVRLTERIHQTVGSRTVNQLVMFDQREVMREDLIQEINDVLGARSVRNLYFTRYIIQ
jgi:flagellar basal body-associated protein FliL